MSELEAIGDATPQEVWLDAARKYAELRGFTFEESCLADLTVFLTNAAIVLRSSSAEHTTDARVQDVERLVQLMIDVRVAEDPAANDLHEWTLIQARTKFCPLFPFC